MIRVMVVDDSPLARKMTSEALEADAELRVAATAPNAEIALKKLETVEPDVITMDLEMPGMGGLEAIRRIMRARPTPVVVLSAYAGTGAELTVQALELGAVDFVAKPARKTPATGADIFPRLIAAVKQASRVRLEHPRGRAAGGASARPGFEPPGCEATPRYRVVVMGASTGGPAALKEVLQRLPGDFPGPVVVVQHMPALFTAAFARRLNSLCRVRVKEAEQGDRLEPGLVLVAPGDRHMEVSLLDGQAHVVLRGGDPVGGHRPSIDVLASSVASAFSGSALGVIMTGMGRDGARGFADLKRKGGYVVAQDEPSSIIFGMNGVVVRNGDAHEVAALDRIAERILRLCSQAGSRSGR